ncbi:PIN domain-containing protein [Nocardia sp. NPDC019395]|uniref:type II toxin-antitoxin system VapC family toxin n=1 Tax=Nocardia sp. NPDC019395 TaxID=3154686 RepID=UPI0033EAA957
MTEACYLLQRRVGAEAEIMLVEAIAAGDLEQVPVSSEDLERIAELMRQYSGFPLGVADASVIAIAERLGLTAVATLDVRHFRAVKPRHTGSFTLLP